MVITAHSQQLGDIRLQGGGRWIIMGKELKEEVMAFTFRATTATKSNVKVEEW